MNSLKLSRFQIEFLFLVYEGSEVGGCYWRPIQKTGFIRSEILGREILFTAMKAPKTLQSLVVRGLIEPELPSPDGFFQYRGFSTNFNRLRTNISQEVRQKWCCCRVTQSGRLAVEEMIVNGVESLFPSDTYDL